MKTCTTCGKPFTPEYHRQRHCPAHHIKGRAGKSPTTQAQDAEYRRERELVLAGDPPCALRLVCDGAPATTADHVIPASKGGGNRGNLQPACGPCNARKSDRDAEDVLRSARRRHSPRESMTRAEFARRLADEATKGGSPPIRLV